jgi:DUF1009 family protein
MAPKLGILAGSGDLPARVARVCQEAGREVFVLAFEGQTDPETVRGMDHVWSRLGAGATSLEALKAQGVAELVMAGPVKRPSLAALRPDLRTARFLAEAGARAFGDDGLLSAIIADLEREGFRVLGIDQILSELLAEAGCYGTVEPDAAARRDIERGLAVARALGEQDVGQAVVVQQGVVLGVEALEGTDALLARCAGLKVEGAGGVLVKVKKPNQERRADLPTIGWRTVERAAQAGLSGIAVEAGGTLVLDRDRVARTADAAGLFVVGLALAGPRKCL